MADHKNWRDTAKLSNMRKKNWEKQDLRKTTTKLRDLVHNIYAFFIKEAVISSPTAAVAE